jgi:hypothetical protein
MISTRYPAFFHRLSRETYPKPLAKDAIEAYLESIRKDGRPIPKDVPITLQPVKEHIRVALQ